jgi:hypothetical protein
MARFGSGHRDPNHRITVRQVPGSLPTMEETGGTSEEKQRGAVIAAQNWTLLTETVFSVILMLAEAGVTLRYTMASDALALCAFCRIRHAACVLLRARILRAIISHS